MQSGADALHDEIERQRQILHREMLERVSLTTLAFALCAAFANPLTLLLIWLLHMALEVAGIWLINPDRMVRSQVAYGAAVVQSALVEATYITAAGLAWQSENPYAKAFAVGMSTMTLMHLATVRSIHFPLGLAGLAGAAGMALTVNSLYWLDRGDFTGLALSTAAAFGAVAYGLTAMLSNNRLHRTMARREAEARAAHAAKSVFLAQMSHELRTPLNAIIGMGLAELAETDQPRAESPSRQRIQTLVENARTLSVILDDVTDIDTIADGKLSLRPRNVCLADEVTLIVSAFRERAARLGIPFEVQAEGPCPENVRLDAVRLRQCLGNLLSNALRHAPDGAITLRCRVEPDPDGAGGMLCFEIADSGPGVPVHLREEIFGAFRKGRAAAPGAGLGLAIARNLARVMGGDLVLLPGDAGPSGGAQFRLSVRYDIAPDPAPAAMVRPDFSVCTILVVDDIATNRTVAASYLRTTGARVIEADTGEAALSILTQEDVSLVLLDMNMPGLDGFETLRRARMMGGRVAALPIVAMTADVLEDQVAAIRQAGFDGHLAKPLLPETLWAELQRLL